MACIFGHKWDGCKCTKCGKIRDEGHIWNDRICTVCGKPQLLSDDDHRIYSIIQKLNSDNRNITHNDATYKCAYNISDAAQVLIALKTAGNQAGVSISFNELYDHDIEYVKKYLKKVLSVGANEKAQYEAMFIPIREKLEKLSEVKKTPALSFWMASELLGFGSVASDVASDIPTDKAELMLKKMFELSYND